MARVHVMEQNGNNTFRIIMHVATPAGNNAVGKLWKDVVKAALLNTTQMVVGNGDGQITTAESNSITAGDVIEHTGVFQYNPLETLAQNNARLDDTATNQINEYLIQLQNRLRFFGHTRT